ncbi:hypothetical protein CEY12_19010 [Chryseobacterium sp. T16E-39]|nr:hypothetical protein CEY12_19010 [Chryseobacterium sp. T16E-39]
MRLKTHFLFTEHKKRKRLDSVIFQRLDCRNLLMFVLEAERELTKSFLMLWKHKCKEKFSERI